MSNVVYPNNKEISGPGTIFTGIILPLLLEIF